LDYDERARAYLVLADGTVFKGYSMGAKGEAVGEVVFNTCTTSFQDILCDPSYYGQLVAQTYPLVGMRGVDGRLPRRIYAKGYIAREWSEVPQGDSSVLSIDEYLRQNGTVGIYGIDTRRLTRALRDKGYFNGAITDKLDGFDSLMDRIQSYSIRGAVDAVTVPKPLLINTIKGNPRVAVIDYGYSEKMAAALSQRGLELKVYPARTSAEEILSEQPAGIVFSNGPGDPEEDIDLIKQICTLLQSGLPSFGIGVGHQMMALAMGGKIAKMPKGHRGSNQPVLRRVAGQTMSTLQNHAYDVVAESLDDSVAEITMININDQSVEAIQYKGIPAFSIQFTPLDNPVYSDTSWIYDDFAAMVRGGE